jgi:hypothetical protein
MAETTKAIPSPGGGKHTYQTTDGETTGYGHDRQSSKENYYEKGGTEPTKDVYKK